MTDYRNHIVEDAEGIRWKVFTRGGQKVEAIKDFRGMTGSGLKEAKDIVEEYAERLTRGEVFNGASNGVVTSYVNLPNGGTLTVTTKGAYTDITYSNTEAVNVRPNMVAQAIVDAALRYS